MRGMRLRGRGVSLAAVSDEDFNALKDLVNKQGGKIDQLEKTHEQDQQEILQLRQQLGQTGQVATNAALKAEAASQIQPAYAAPTPSATAAHNFIVTGDAEVQYGKTAGRRRRARARGFRADFSFSGQRQRAV